MIGRQLQGHRAADSVPTDRDLPEVEGSDQIDERLAEGVEAVGVARGRRLLAVSEAR